VSEEEGNPTVAGLESGIKFAIRMTEEGENGTFGILNRSIESEREEVRSQRSTLAQGLRKGAKGDQE